MEYPHERDMAATTMTTNVSSVFLVVLVFPILHPIHPLGLPLFNCVSLTNEDRSETMMLRQR